MNNRWFGLVCIGLMVLFGLWALPQLPSPAPVHWNMQGQPDGFAPAWIAAFLMPVVSLGVWLVFRFLPARDPISSDEGNARIMARYGNWITLFLLAVHVATIVGALGATVDAARLIVMATGALFVVIGNEMGRLKPNSWAGIRVPWTIMDEEVWRQSNRVGGRAMVIAGLLSIVLAALLPLTIIFGAMLVCLLGSVIFMGSYSYWVAQRKRRAANH